MPEPKPNLKPETKKLLARKNRMARRRPEFRRQEWFRYGKFNDSWRKPRGKHSKLREHLDWRPPVVDAGYRGPRDVRGLHPSGFREVMVYNVNDLLRINKDIEAARIGSTVGAKKREQIVQKADELSVKVLNRGSQ